MQGVNVSKIISILNDGKNEALNKFMERKDIFMNDDIIHKIFIWACYVGQTHIVSELMRAGRCDDAQLNYGVIITSKNGHINIVKIMFDFCNIYIKTKQEILSIALEKNNIGLIEYLIENVDPYNYISILDTRHLRYIKDNKLCGMIIRKEKRKRIIHKMINNNYCDITIETQ